MHFSRILIGHLLIALFSISHLFSQQNIIVDADTGNEVDDFYALARIFLEPTINVTVLNAAHWQTSQWAIANTMENSHRLNQQLVGEMGLTIKTKRGAMARMFDWGDRAQHSAAAYEIIRQAKENDKTTILVLGALTNVASAVYIEPTIADKLEIFWLGTTMDFETGVLKRNDFNPMMDQYALDYLLESKATFNIIPLNVAVDMKVDFDELNTKIGKHALGKFLMKRWIDHIDGSRRNRILWDLALVSVFIHPEMGTTKVITTSKDSGNRPITFYETIDAKAIYNDFYKSLLAFGKE
jgi:inosine-uridine nucleoside N-ribohydrolase